MNDKYLYFHMVFLTVGLTLVDLWCFWIVINWKNI